MVFNYSARMLSSPAQRSACLAFFMFVSGFCSLAYQVVWLREFRLVFGGSTLAASAVLAVFMGALGLGSWILGRKADQSVRPGRFYAMIELLIGLTVLISPLLLILANKLYYMTGGIQQMGSLALLLQMLITITVIAAPCFLMGGTLPAAIRLVQTDEDEVRRSSALMYGMNIAGAVMGAFIVNFYCLEVLGNTKSLLMAAGLNLILAAVAYYTVAMHQAAQEPTSNHHEKNDAAWLLYSLAFFSGFSFFVMELLWFRSSVPLLGGSVYNFGLILVVALIGMSMGGLLYSLIIKYLKPSYALLAFVSALFAMAIAIPYIWGDGFVRFCKVMQAGYLGYPLGDKLWVWFIIAGFLALPASLLAGVQFPLILSLIGKGKDEVGQQTGRVYAFNTTGAVAGSILGGFVLIPQLSINYTWLSIIASALLVALCIALFALSRRASYAGLATIGLTCVVVALVIQGSGLTVYWLQNPIGFGRSLFEEHQTPLNVEHEKRVYEHEIIYQYDGLESSGALSLSNDLSLLNNGKSDGTALGDVSTQIMVSMLPALLHHSEPERTCVIGLGTGMTAGWLAQVESVKSVDVYELEPQVAECAKSFASMNYDVTNHPKVKMIYGDAREGLLALKDKDEYFDLIASEPPNPQRVGVANLFTREYYQTVSDKLNEDGVFAQWLQAYEIKLESVNLIMATLGSVFPQVCVYQTLDSDLLFVCYKKRKTLPVELMRSKLKRPAYRLAADRALGTHAAEGVLSHSVANSKYVSELGKALQVINTDDRNLLEFQVARTGGVAFRDPIQQILDQATREGLVIEGIDSGISALRFNYALASTAHRLKRKTTGWEDATWFDGTAALRRSKLLKQLVKTLRNNKDLVFEALNPREKSIWARALARTANERFLEYCETFKDDMPLDYSIARLEYFWVTNNTTSEDLEILDLIKKIKGKIWHLPHFLNVENCLTMINQRLEESPDRLAGKEAEVLLLLQQPFESGLMEAARSKLRITLASRLGSKYLLPVLRDLEPFFPLNDPELLEKRVEVYREHGDSNLQKAEQDLELFNTWR